MTVTPSSPSTAPSRSQPSRDGAPLRTGSIVALTLCTLVALAILLSLGKWQLDRLAWKDDLISKISSRTAAAPAAPPPESAWPAMDVHADEYSHVRLTGRFDFSKQVLVHVNAPKEHGVVRAGYVTLTPMTLADGSVVLVNRGFVPLEMRSSLAAVDARTPEDATVTGLLRASQKRESFVPEDDPAKGEWFTRDISAIAAAKQLKRVAPFIVDADAAGTYTEGPRGGLTVISFPNRHLEYALTWFGLAATLIGVYAAFIWRRRSSAPET